MRADGEGGIVALGNVGDDDVEFGGGGEARGGPSADGEGNRDYRLHHMLEDHLAELEAFEGGAGSEANA